MENKQLASYWIAEKITILVENLMKGYYKNQESFDEDWQRIFNYAGEMEKEQIMMAYNDGRVNQGLKQNKNSGQYYNETYGTK